MPLVLKASRLQYTPQTAEVLSRVHWYSNRDDHLPCMQSAPKSRNVFLLLCVIWDTYMYVHRLIVILCDAERLTLLTTLSQSHTNTILSHQRTHSTTAVLHSQYPQHVTSTYASMYVHMHARMYTHTLTHTQISDSCSSCSNHYMEPQSGA